MAFLTFTPVGAIWIEKRFLYQERCTKLSLERNSFLFPIQLRDIFRVHPDTPCNTHDLLECNCDKDSDSCEVEPEALPQSAVEKPLEKTASMGFITASEVTPEHITPIDQAVRSFLSCLLESITDVALEKTRRLGCACAMETSSLSRGRRS